MPTIFGLPACSCQVKWCPAYKAELARRGIVIRFVQLIGRGGKSAGTHGSGGADDFYLVSWPKGMTKDRAWGIAIAVGRQMGSDARWRRRYNWDGRGGEEHGHGVLTGCPHNGPARYQIDDVRRGLNGLANHGKDDGARPLSGRTWQEGIAWAKAQQKAAQAAAKPSKPAAPIRPWFNVGFLNIHGNNNAAAATVGKRLPDMTDVAAAGSPAVHGFCEVRSAQLPALRDSMAARGYLFTGYSHMIAVFHRPHVTIRGTSFARYTQQDGGTVEGIYRIGITVDGSKAQIGFTHLDHDSSEAKKRHNLREAYNALRRYGALPLRTQWKKRTVIIGDFNDTDVAAKVLKPLGFKAVFIAGIDQAWVGAGRVTRGGSKTKTNSDHPRILARLGRK